MPVDEWTWYGHPGHFIAARSCRFILHTHVDDYCVSTVGDYWPGSRKGAEGPERIGADRLYETMVFKREDDLGGCDGTCPHGSGGEIDFDAYNTCQDANAGHLRMCLKVAEGRVGEEDSNAAI